MRKPLTAPTFKEIYEKVIEKRTTPKTPVADLFARMDPRWAERYLHWDEILHRAPPKGLTHEEWWFLLKIQRLNQKQIVSLTDVGGNAFSYGLSAFILENLHQIDLRAGGQIGMPDPILNPNTRDAYYVSSLMEEAITSSQLEGATTTRQIAKEMLRTGRRPRDRSEQMILNNFLTMRRIGELKHQPLTRELILEIHRLVTHETLDDATAAGRYRAPDEKIGVYDNRDHQLMHAPPPAEQLPERIDAICQFANRTEPFVHPVIRSMVLHFMLGYDHPFVDGNGRTARALFYWSMLRHGYWLAEFISISQIVLKAPAQYSRAFLHTETDEGDLTYFIIYHLKIIQRALVSLNEYISRKAAELRQFETELRAVEFLNHRQQALIRHAMRHPGSLYTVKGHQQIHNCSYESARTDLLDLSKRDLLEVRQKGRQGSAWVFVAKPQLAGRLAAIAGGVSGVPTLT